MIRKSDIIELLNEVLNQSPTLRKGGMQVVYFCPFCNHYKKKLEICLSEGINFTKWHCWTCNAGGNFLGSLLRKLNSSSQYRERLFKVTGDIKLTRNYTKKLDSRIISLPAEFISLVKYGSGPEYKNAMSYIKSRGISLVDIIRFNIGYCEEGCYKNHIIIPSYDVDGNLNFFMGRRYYDTDGVLPHKKPLCDMNIVGCELFINWSEPVILVESIFNAITIRRNVIPLFGKYPSKKLYEAMIINKVKIVYVFLDSDATKDAIRVCEYLIKIGITPYFVDINKGKDPNEIGFVESWECIKNAKKVDFSFIINKKLKIC